MFYLSLVGSGTLGGPDSIASVSVELKSYCIGCVAWPRRPLAFSVAVAVIGQIIDSSPPPLFFLVCLLWVCDSKKSCDVLRL